MIIIGVIINYYFHFLIVLTDFNSDIVICVFTLYLVSFLRFSIIISLNSLLFASFIIHHEFAVVIIFFSPHPFAFNRPLA